MPSFGLIKENYIVRSQPGYPPPTLLRKAYQIPNIGLNKQKKEGEVGVASSFFLSFSRKGYKNLFCLFDSMFKSKMK